MKPTKDLVISLASSEVSAREAMGCQMVIALSMGDGPAACFSRPK